MDVSNYDGRGALPTLYSKTAAGAVNTWVCWVDGPHVHVLWGQEGGQQQSAKFACNPKNESRANATTAEEQAIKEAIAKWQKQVKKKYHWERDHVLTKLNLKPMLAKKYEDHVRKIEWPATAQPKYDGVRCLAYLKDGKVFLQSRGGEEYKLSHISEELQAVLPVDQVLDGELYVHGLSLQDLNSLVRRPQEGSIVVQLHVYDYTMIGAAADFGAALTWHGRQAARQAFFSRYQHLLKYTIQTTEYTVTNEEEVTQAHKAFVAQGFEGAIIRTHGTKSAYRFGYRSDALLKVKAWQDAEFRIIGFTNGKGKFESYPIFKCVTEDGKEFDCMPNGTDEARRQMLAEAPQSIGKLLKVAYFDLTDDGCPHYPRGLAIRDASDLS